MDKELPVSAWPEWRIIEKIGEGSFGKVYRAQRTEQGRSFYSAIKIITIPGSRSELNSVCQETGSESAAREYFQNLVEECIQEISTMENFRGNSHVVSVEDFKVMEYLDEIGWDISIRMEFLTSFLDYCVGRELIEKEVVKLGRDLCKALEYCGQMNIIHRDIKPENIFVSCFGDFKLGDFGIARELERSMGSMSKKGTYSYMAPEMYRGEAYDSRVDIYSLGIVLYRLMNKNRLPFLSLDKQLITYRDKENALAKRMAGEALPAPSDASEAFSKIILRACAFRPEDRYKSPSELLRDLEALYYQRKYQGFQVIHEETAIKAEPTVIATKPEKSSRRELEPSGPGKTPDDIPEPQVGRRISISGIRKRRGFRLSPKVVTTLAVVGAICILGGVYINNMLAEQSTARNYQKVVDVLEDNDVSTVQIDDFSTAIQTIREQVTEIANELPDCTVEGKAGDKLLYYNSDGKLIKALIYPETSDDGVYEEYYYWDERLFFAYTWTDEKEELYYYDTRGKLIRWIDQDGTVHDKESDSTEYTKRGEKYWKISLEQFD